MAGERPTGVTAWRVLQPYWTTVSIYDGGVRFLDEFDRLPTPIRHLLAVFWCDSEVCNGGFHQFFSNSTGVLAREAIDGFRAVGLEAHAQLVETAVGHFHDPFPPDRGERQEVLERLALPGDRRKDWDPFYELDDQYYARSKQHNFDATLNEYARRRAADPRGSA